VTLMIKVAREIDALFDKVILRYMRVSPREIEITVSSGRRYLLRSEDAVGGGTVLKLYELRPSNEFCVHRFGDDGCRIDVSKLAAGQPNECDKTHEMCRDVHHNLMRFGGFPGMPQL